MKKLISFIILLILMVFNPINMSASTIENNGVSPYYLINKVYATNVTDTSATLNVEYIPQTYPIDTNNSYVKIDLDGDGTFETDLNAEFLDSGEDNLTKITVEATDLNPGTTYQFQAVVMDMYHSATMATGYFTTHEIGVPTVSYISNTSATLNVDYTLAGDQINLDAPLAFAPEMTVDGYFEISADGGQTFAEVDSTFSSDATTGVGTGTAVIPTGNLTPDTTYTVRATVNTSGGSTLVSENVEFTTKSVVMDVTDITETTASFSAAYNLQKDDLAQDNATLNIEESYFEYWQKDDIDNKTKVYFDDVNTNDTATTILVTGLLANTTYQVQATVVTNEQATVSTSDVVEFTTLESQPTEIVIETPIKDTDNTNVDTSEEQALEDTGSESYIVILLLAVVGIISSLVFKFIK